MPRRSFTNGELSLLIAHKNRGTKNAFWVGVIYKLIWFHSLCPGKPRRE